MGSVLHELDFGGIVSGSQIIYFAFAETSGDRHVELTCTVNDGYAEFVGSLIDCYVVFLDC